MKCLAAARLVTALLLSFAFMSVFASSSVKSRPVRPQVPDSRPSVLSALSFFGSLRPGNTQLKNSPGLSKRKSLSKRAAAQALAWKQIGSTTYDNSNNFGIGAPVWQFSNRDTTEYDAYGNIVVEKSSVANSGWNTDSLTNIDSMVYLGGKLTEEFYENYYYPGTGIITDGNHYTFSYLNGGKTLVEIYYSWNGSQKVWEPSFKDSIIFSGASAPNWNTLDASGLVAYYQSRFDTVGGSWKAAGYMQRIDAECNALTLTLAGKQPMDNTADTLVDEEVILTFNSTVWTYNNTVEERDQRIDPLTKTYYDEYKWVYSYNAGGYPTGFQIFQYDSLTGTLLCVSKSLYHPDAHGNDTLNIDYNYTMGMLTDSSEYRYERTYDPFGNNIQVIEYDYDSYMGTWQESNKTINVFAQINSSVISLKQFESKRNISVEKTNGRICFSGPNITSLMLYNASGRLLASVKQKPAPSLVLDLPGQKARLVAGVYVARLLCDGRETSMPLVIGR